MALASSTETTYDAPESPGPFTSRASSAPRPSIASSPPEREDDGPVYTVTEAARLARVSVQALRQRISRGTLFTTRVVRDRRVVAGIPRTELARAYPELADAESSDLDRILHGTPTAATASKAYEKSRQVIAQLRRKLAKEREIRARVQGVVEDQERRLEELQIERVRLERSVAELDNRLIFLDGFRDEAPARPAWWRRGTVWARVVVVGIVLATFFAAGGAYWQQLDARFEALTTSLGGGAESPGLADAETDAAAAESDALGDE